MQFRKISFSEKNIIKYSLIIVFIFSALILIVYFSLRLSLSAIISQKKWLDPQFWATGIIFLAGIIFITILRYFLNKIDYWLDNAERNLKNALKGNWGEKKTFEEFQKILGADYKIYRNFKIQNRKFDNDAIIIGPKGIISIEIKNIHGDFEFIGEETYKHNWRYGNECLCKLNEWKSPTREVLRHCEAFEKWLSESGFNGIKLKRAILLVDTKARIIKLENPAVYVVKGLNDLAKYIENSYNDSLFTPEFCEKLDKLLSERK